MQRGDRGTIVFVLGGVRSGKSRYAQQIAGRFNRVAYVATASAHDEEMAEKIRRHREERPASWQTFEEPIRVGELLKSRAASFDCVLIDCLTVFASNVLDRAQQDPSAIDSEIRQLLEALENVSSAIVIVSNEVGSGVVPAYPSGRRYRDLLGELNQRVASIADRVVLMVAGLPLVLKDSAEVHP